jgi:hypothetical protein
VVAKTVILNLTNKKNFNMKKIIFNCFVLLSLIILLSGCKKGVNYPGGMVTPYIPLYDLRNLYKGTDVVLSSENMFGSTSLSAMVISDHSGKNLPEGMLFVQDKKRLGQLRGIAIPIGAEASKYVPGDSVHIKIEGTTLTRADGMLQLKGVNAAEIKKVASGLPIAKNRVNSSAIFANPDKYESTLVIIVKAGFDPLPKATDVLSGDKIINDGFADITLHTESTATFANDSQKFSANYYTIVINKQGANGNLLPHLRLRRSSDVIVLSSTPEIPAVIITGWIPDPKGTNANNCYIQFIATRDINFASEKFSVVTTNNAGASTPTGFPANGWATGGLRTYKFNITEGSVKKGGYFYVGGAGAMINSTSSTKIPAAQYVKAQNYNTTAGNGFGQITSNLLANSGNAYGIAVFNTHDVVEATRPIDCVFISSGGSLFTAGPPAQGYRVANNDFYDAIDPIDLIPQPFYRQGTNILFHPYHPNAVSDLGYYYKAGGVYSVTLGKWKKAREVKHFILSKTSPMSDIEADNIVISDVNGKEVRDTIPVTKIE